MLRIALAQINATVGDLTGNRRRVLKSFNSAAKARADLVIFPELILTGYPPEDLLFKEQFVRDNLKSLSFFAKRVKGPVAIVGFVDQGRGGERYNAAAVIADGKVKGVYRKHHLPNYGVFDEKRYFHEGRGHLILMLGGIPVGVNICEDIWKQKGIADIQARAGARVLVNISASPYDFGKLEQRERLLINRARRTKSFVAYVNLVGGQDELVFDGGSLIVDPKGHVTASGKLFEEDLVIADLDVSRKSLGKTVSKGVKVIRQPLQAVQRAMIKPPRVGRLTPDERMLKALILGTRDYVHKNGFGKVVVGLSGGIDSSLVAAIAVKAIGRANVIGVSMPSKFSSPGTKNDARLLAKNLKIRLLTVPIQSVLKSYADVLAPAFAGRREDKTEENLQARIRGNILMALSNKFGWMVVTTGNKSEIAVGYCTLYGDLSGGFAVIKDVPKMKVYALAELINSQDGPVIPQSVLDRAPSAELKENQKDQDSLPPYDLLDRMIRAYVEEHRSLKAIRRMVKDAALVKKFIRMVDYSEYKRRQAPPGVKITLRAFGKDWRLPITNRYHEF